MPHTNRLKSRPEKPKDPRQHGLKEPSTVIEEDFHVDLQDHLVGDGLLIADLASLANNLVQNMTSLGYTISQQSKLVIEYDCEPSIEYSVRYQNAFYANDKIQYDERMAQYHSDLLRWEKNEQEWQDKQVVRKSLQEIDAELGDLKTQMANLQKMRALIQEDNK